MKCNMITSKDVHNLVNSFSIKEGDKVAITFNTKLEQEIAHKVAELVNCKGAKPIMIHVPASYNAVKCEESCVTKEGVYKLNVDADIWIEL